MKLGLKWRHFFIYAALGAVAVGLVAHFGQLAEFGHLLRRARWYVLLLVLLAQAFSYYCNASYYRSFLEIFDYRIPLRRLYEAALSINFVNQVFPSGGISGTSFLSTALRGEVPTGKATLAQLVRYFFTYVSFIVVLALGFLMLFLGNNDSRGTTKVALLLMLFIIIGSLILMVLVGDRPRAEKFAAVAVRFINWVSRIVSRRRRKVITPERVANFFDEFYHGYHLLLTEKGHWRRPLLWALGGNVAEVATVYVVFVAFSGHLVNPGVIIAGYTLANIISLFAFFTGGVGLYEATMIATFVTLGVPYALALPVVIVYRALNFVLFLPLGFYYYRQALE